jgi:hypothetical protein
VFRRDLWRSLTWARSIEYITPHPISLRSSDDKASLCFRPFWVGKLSDKC